MSQLSGQIFTAIALLTGGLLIARAKENTRVTSVPATYINGSNGFKSFEAKVISRRMPAGTVNTTSKEGHPAPM
jgi:hypothetical protein